MLTVKTKIILKKNQIMQWPSTNGEKHIIISVLKLTSSCKMKLKEVQKLQKVQYIDVLVLVYIKVFLF